MKSVSVANTKISGIDLEIAPGEAVVLFGRAGMGKRAVLKIAAGVLKPGGGEVLWDEEAARAPMPVAFTPGTGGLIHNLTLLQNVCLPVLFHGLLTRAAAREKGASLLAEFGIETAAGLLPSAVGEVARRLTLIARALLVSPPLYLFEEPRADLDQSVIGLVDATLARIKSGGRAALVSTGGVRPYLDWADTFYFLGRGGCRAFRGRKELEGSDDPEARVFL